MRLRNVLWQHSENEVLVVASVENTSGGQSKTLTLESPKSLKSIINHLNAIIESLIDHCQNRNMCRLYP